MTGKTGWHVDPEVTYSVKFHPSNQNDNFDPELIKREKNYHTMSFIYKDALALSLRHLNNEFTRKRYTGEFLNNQFHGYGVIIYENGTKYEGYWDNGSKRGLGTLLSKDGVSRGIFNNDEKIGPNI